MSHHLDTEAAQNDPRIDISDVYLFRGTSGTVFVINVNPVSAPHEYHPEALYEFKVDSTGDAVEDLTLRVTFGPLLPDGRQTVEVRRLKGADARDRNALGEIVATGTTEREIIGKHGLRLFAGRAGEPFYIDADVITEVRRAMGTGTPIDLSGFDPATAQNLFGETNVSTIVVEVPSAITGTGKIGFWGATALPDHAGGWGQINRAAKPLVNTIWDFTRDGTVDVDYNASDPREGKALFGKQVAEQTAALVRAMKTANNPSKYGEWVRDLVFPDVLRYKVGTKANFGVSSQNGKGLTESAPESMFELIAKTHIEMGLDAGDATGELRDEFPYLSLPREDLG